MPITLPADIDTTPEDNRIYAGLSRQDLRFHQALAELIDNGISASKQRDFFEIEVHVEKCGEEVKLLVADSGHGMKLQNIQSAILRIGGQGEIGNLNEHGFGLKNSLCVLTGNTRAFRVVTRDAEAVGHDLIYKVEGPFRRDMKVVAATLSEWNEDITHCRADTGTRVYANTTYHYFRSLYPSGKLMDTLITRLLEHLGVLYREYLKDRRNQLWLRWRDITEGQVVWTDELVKPIEIPYRKAYEEQLTIGNGGKTHKVTYKWGILDSDAAQDSALGKPFPLKIYYQANQQTQGVDISVRGRVILPHALEYIWSSVVRHNEANEFVGELIIPDKEFSTVNNKTQLDPNNSLWEKLLELLDDERFKPRKTVNTGYGEREVRVKLKAKLEAHYSGSTAQENFPTWPGTGVQIDLLHKIDKSTEEIYELKAGDARPQDVYQLVMYWDGRVSEGFRPRLGRLVARAANDHVINLVEYWNKRKDAGDKPYKLEFKRIADLI